jgi:hypothetical protein
VPEDPKVSVNKMLKIGKPIRDTGQIKSTSLFLKSSIFAEVPFTYNETVE